MAWWHGLEAWLGSMAWYHFLIVRLAGHGLIVRLARHGALRTRRLGRTSASGRNARVAPSVPSILASYSRYNSIKNVSKPYKSATLPSPLFSHTAQIHTIQTQCPDTYYLATLPRHTVQTHCPDTHYSDTLPRQTLFRHDTLPSAPLQPTIQPHCPP